MPVPSNNPCIQPRKRKNNFTSLQLPDSICFCAASPTLFRISVVNSGFWGFRIRTTAAMKGIFNGCSVVLIQDVLAWISDGGASRRLQLYHKLKKSRSDISVEVVLGQGLRDARNIFLHSSYWLSDQVSIFRAFLDGRRHTDSAIERICLRRVTASGSSYLRRCGRRSCSSSSASISAHHEKRAT
jgi:hypothetical protein